MTGEERRQKIVYLLKSADSPLSGTELGRQLHVSRQIVVQDIALLRTQGHDIISTARGYTIAGALRSIRVLKVCHTTDALPDELQTIVDLGGECVDVFINHKIYGKLHAPLHIKSRRDVRHFLDDLKNGRSTPLCNITNGYHFHTIEAENTEILDEIEQALSAKGYLAMPADYEQDLLES